MILWILWSVTQWETLEDRLVAKKKRWKTTKTTCYAESGLLIGLLSIPRAQSGLFLKDRISDNTFLVGKLLRWVFKKNIIKTHCFYKITLHRLTVFHYTLKPLKTALTHLLLIFPLLKQRFHWFVYFWLKNSAKHHWNNLFTNSFKNVWKSEIVLRNIEFLIPIINRDRHMTDNPTLINSLNPQMPGALIGPIINKNQIILKIVSEETFVLYIFCFSIFFILLYLDKSMNLNFWRACASGREKQSTKCTYRPKIYLKFLLSAVFMAIWHFKASCKPFRLAGYNLKNKNIKNNFLLSKEHLLFEPSYC